MTIVVLAVLNEASNRYKKLFPLEVTNIIVKHDVFCKISFKASLCSFNLNVAESSWRNSLNNASKELAETESESESFTVKVYCKSDSFTIFCVNVYSS